jgi:hypothetical protein
MQARRAIPAPQVSHLAAVPIVDQQPAISERGRSPEAEGSIIVPRGRKHS